MVAKILCVAEKPSIAKAVANHLGSSVRVRNVQGNNFVKNYEFDFEFSPPWGKCSVIMTSVLGHLTSNDFEDRYRGWTSIPPIQLFELPIIQSYADDKKPIAKNIETQARYCRSLFLWTDCDREGEHIGSEIRDAALRGKPGIEVKRARFSNIERGHVIHAAKNPVSLDEKQANAVAARIELDLRIGAAYTRMLSLNLKPIVAPVQDLKLISYGSCQFPTLGFVVDRYFKVQNFIPEPFWKITLTHTRTDIKVTFTWKRVHLFDRMAVTIIFERCLSAGKAKVTKIERKPTSKWKPLPLTTVELQKAGSRFLRMDSQRTMKIAEDLYNRGLISYPRTETDQFDREMDLRKLVEKQVPDNIWGNYAQGLMDGGFNVPRSGRNNDQAHPPIHPVNHADRNALRDDDERRVYEYITRRFLAACSSDAKGESSTVELTWSTETFSAHGLTVLERNYLDVYPYDKWESSRQLPKFELYEQFVPDEANVGEGKTTPPGYLTEPELIALMDANGIGTDATMAEHIATIKARAYVMVRRRGAQVGDGVDDESDEDSAPATRGGGRGRGRGRGRGGRGGGANATRGGNRGGVEEFIPSTLGVALVDGYDKMGLDVSLSKPFLRKEMELQMKAICDGTMNRNDVVQESLEKYREVYVRSTQQIDVLKNSFRRYVLGQSI